MNDTPTTKPEQLYTATLMHGQTYVYRKRTFEFGVPEVINREEYDYLRLNATKSVRVGDDNEMYRQQSNYFTFAKVKAVVSTDDIDDDDLLDEVDISTARRARPVLNVREEAVDVDAPEGAGDMGLTDLRAPGAPVRAEPVAPVSRARRTRSKA